MSWDRPPYFNVAYYLLKSFAILGQLFVNDVKNTLSLHRQKSSLRLYLQYLLEQGFILPSNHNSFIITNIGLKIIESDAPLTAFLLSDPQFQSYYSLLLAEDRLRKGLSLTEKEILRTSSLMNIEEHSSLELDLDNYLSKRGRPSPLRGLIEGHQVGVSYKGLLHQNCIPELIHGKMSPKYGKTQKNRREILQQLGEYPDAMDTRASFTSSYLSNPKACWLFFFLCMAQRQELGVTLKEFSKYLKKRKIPSSLSIEKEIEALRLKGIPISVSKEEGVLSLYGDVNFYLPLTSRLEDDFTHHIWDFINKKTKTVESLEGGSMFSAHSEISFFSSSIELLPLESRKCKTLREIKEWQEVGPVFFPFQSIKDDLHSLALTSVPHVWGRGSYNEDDPHSVLDESPVLYLLTVLLVWVFFQQHQVQIKKTQDREYSVFYQSKGPYSLFILIRKVLKELGFIPLFCELSPIESCLLWLQRVGWVCFLPGTISLEEGFQDRLGYTYEIERYWRGPLPTRIKEAFKEVFNQWERS